MRWSNVHGLPQSLVNAITRDDYKPKEGKRISVTTLLKPAQARALESVHADGIVQDVADHIYRLLGQSVHSVLEDACDKYYDFEGEDDEPYGSNAPFDISNLSLTRKEKEVVNKAHRIIRKAEERISKNELRVEESEIHYENILNGWTVSGYIDLLETDGTLSDFKVTSVYSFLLGDKPEFVKQLNIYKWLAEKNGRVVDRLRIVAILRDWQRSKYEGQEGDYPVAPALSMPIEMWPREKVEALVAERVAAHEKAMLDPASVPCTAEERWERAAKCAVMQEGKKRALRLLPTQSEAREFIKNTGITGLSIEDRPALQRRCESFCIAAPWCEQRKALGVEIKGGD